MTRYIAAYDTEMSAASRPSPAVPTCLEACRRIVEAHHAHRMPATFFLLGRTLEESPGEFRRLLDDPLFEVASHSWSHGLFREHPVCGPAIAPARFREEIRRGKDAVEQVFGKACAGLRPGCGYAGGFRGMTDVLSLVAEAGYRYVSSSLWGPDYSLPAPLSDPWSYAEEGFPGIAEYPGHGWHENLLKGNNRVFGQGPRRTVLFPSPLAEAVPPREIAGVEEEMRYNSGFFIDAADRAGATYVSLIWHPWSLALFDPGMRMLDLTFRLVRDRGLEPCTFEALDRARAAAARPVP